MDIINTIIGKIGECTVDSIRRQFRYVTYYDENIKALEQQVEKMETMENEVHEAIAAAERNNEEIRKVVQHWIARVGAVKAEAKKLLEDYGKASKRCFKGWFPDLTARYMVSRESVNKLAEIKELSDEGSKFDTFSIPAPPLGIDFIPSKDLILFPTTKAAIEKVINALTDDSVNFVGMHGMGGVGKTTLVKEITRISKQDKLFDNVVMAVVSQTVIVEKIQDQIADQLGLKFEKKSQSGRASQLYKRLKAEKRILVVLDDVWSKIELETIGIPFGDDHKGCKVIITTRREQVCKSMGITNVSTRIITLSVLTATESWNMLKVHIGDIIESPTIKTEAIKVIKECAGLPIALATVGRAMRDKDPENWKEAAQEIEKSNPTNIEDVEERVFKCIRFSYDYLRDEEAKSCFLLCCLFPEDYDIEIEKVVRYSVGLHIFKKVDTIQQARRRAHLVINNLKAASLLVASEKEGCIKMHDVVRDVAKTIADDTYFVKAGEGLKEFPREVTETDYNGIGISLMSNQISSYPNAWNCPNLQILLMQHNDVFQPIPEGVFEGMKWLRVLDRSHNSVHVKMEPSFNCLTNLQTLIMEGGIWMWDITPLGELKKLEVLSFRGLAFQGPLDALKKLKNLRLLDFTYCFGCGSLFNYITGEDTVSSLSRLEELHATDNLSSAESGFSVAKLKLLPRLVVLTLYAYDIRCIPQDFVFPQLDDFTISIGMLPYYEFKEMRIAHHYYYSRKTQNRLELVGSASLEDLDVPWPHCLEALLCSAKFVFLSYLTGLKNILPYFLVNRDSLALVKFLILRRCNEIEWLMNIEEFWQVPLQAPQDQLICFPDLEELSLLILKSFRGLCKGNQRLLSPYSFSKLKILRIQSCSEMSSIGAPFGLLQRMKQLEVLEIQECDALEYLFDLEDNGVDEKQHVLVKLKALTLVNLPRLEHLWKGQMGSLHPGNLQAIHIEFCPKLKSLFSWTVAQRLEQLQSMTVYDCEELEWIIEANAIEEKDVNNVLFPQLEELWLSGLPKLARLYRGNLTVNHIAPKLKMVNMGGRYRGITLDGTDLDTFLQNNQVH